MCSENDDDDDDEEDDDDKTQTTKTKLYVQMSLGLLNHTVYIRVMDHLKRSIIIDDNDDNDDDDDDNDDAKSTKNKNLCTFISIILSYLKKRFKKIIVNEKDEKDEP